MRSLEESDIHYIRCVKPNESNSASKFEPPFVLGQLRACGTVETINICRHGFTARWRFFCVLVPMQKSALIFYVSLKEGNFITSAWFKKNFLMKENVFRWISSVVFSLTISIHFKEELCVSPCLHHAFWLFHSFQIDEMQSN